MDYSNNDQSKRKTERLTIDEAKEIVNDAMTEREDWLSSAKESWREIKKRNKNDRVWNVSPNSKRRRQRFPVWANTHKIRMPLVYSRTPEPVAKDSTGGDDPTGRTAAIVLERLARAIRDTFAWDRVLKSICSDMLATDFGAGRIYFEIEEVMQKRRVPVVPVADPMTGVVNYVDESGEQVDPTAIQTDETNQTFIELDELVGVENERVCLKPKLYSEVLVDSTARTWEDVQSLGYIEELTMSEFRRRYGREAVADVSEDDKKITGARATVTVIELWHKPSRAVYWFTLGGGDFLRVEDDIYELVNFFPQPEPLVFNAPTDSFWPVCEFYQLQDLIEELHVLASRIFSLTRAIRTRFLFDNTVDSLQTLINDTAEADGIGVANLQQSLQSGGGSLDGLVAFFPVGQMVAALNELYKAFADRLSQYYQLTGVSDLLRGQTDGVPRTYGEQQLKSRYAMSQLEPMQKDVQRWCRDAYQLLCELALKRFSDATLDKYIQPATLDVEDQQRYRAALALLKSDDRRRFRIDIETDSTIALNEDFERAATLEVANTVAKALQETATVVQQLPELGAPMVRMLKAIVRSFRLGKHFEDEVLSSLEAVEKRVQQPVQPEAPQPDPTVMMQLQVQERIAAAETMSRERIEVFRAQARDRESQLEAQIAVMKQQQASQQAMQTLQADLERVRGELMIAQQELALKARELESAASIDAMRAELEAVVARMEAAIEQRRLEIEAYEARMRESEKLIEEQRLARQQMIDAAARTAPPMNITLQMPPRGRQRVRVVKDPLTGSTVYEPEEIG